MKILFPLTLLAGVAVGCRAAPQAYVPTPPAKVEAITAEIANGSAVMPLDEGNHWTYTMDTESIVGGKPAGKQESIATYRVVADKGGGNAYLVLEVEGKTVDAQDWRVTPDGLFQITTGVQRVPTVPPQPLALIPMTAGRRFTWQGKAAMPDGSISHGTSQGEILAEQVVDTAMGPLSAIPVETHTKFATGESDNISWFRPGIGLVRYRQVTSSHGQTIILTMALTNYTTLK